MKRQNFLYVDSSVLVLSCTGHSKFKNWSDKNQSRSDEWVTSEISIVETQAGLMMQAQGDASRLLAFEQNMNRYLVEIQCVAFSSLVSGVARGLVRQYRGSLGLRSLDAIQVASAQVLRQGFGEDVDLSSFSYLTADKRQHAVFTAEGWIGEYLEI